MTRSWTLFKQLFKQKTKSAYLLIIIQLIAALVLTLLGIFSSSDEMGHAEFFGIPLQSTITIGVITFLIIFMMLSIFTNIVYWIITSRQNEKVNRSQTWQLIPISSPKLYVINTLSSFVSYVYLGIIQAVIGLGGAIIVYAASSKFRAGIAELITLMNKDHVWSQIDWGMLAAELILVLLLGLAWYITVSFYHFTTRSIIDFLPSAAARFTTFVVRVIMLILIIVLLVKFFQTTDNIYNNWMFNSGKNYFWFVVIDFALYDVIFGGINIVLMKKFVEAKGDR